VLPSQPLSRGSAEAAIVDHSGQVQIRGRGGNRSRRETTGLGGEMDRAMASGVVVDDEKQQSDETDAWPWRLVPTCRSHARIFRRWPCAHWLCPLGRPDPLCYFGHLAIYLCYCTYCVIFAHCPRCIIIKIPYAANQLDMAMAFPPAAVAPPSPGSMSRS
jgi:hypothetical protein